MVGLGGGDLGLVPTMGAFHEGHLLLMRAARGANKTVCVSLFVNPLQFGAHEDLDRYPRNEERDFDLAEQSGVDIIFAPPVQEMYPRQSTTIHVPEITEIWEGSARRGHFDGVATIVAKLFNIVRPRHAYFGWKDLQQCLVVKRLAEDLNLLVELHFLETARERDGLAMSSRNAYLSSEERAKAPRLYATLVHVAEQLHRNELSPASLLREARTSLSVSGFDVQYLELVSMEDLRPTGMPKNSALIVAARLGTTRLIDNLRL